MRSAFAGVLSVLALTVMAAEDEAAVRLGEATTSTWRIGVEVSAPQGHVTGVLATMPVPMDWPEQTVKVAGEDKSPQAKVTFRTLDGLVRQMVVSIPKVIRGETAHAIMTFEVTKRELLEPASTAGLLIPAKSSRETSKFLLPSPYIETTDPKIKSLAAEIAGQRAGGWDRSAAIFDWVRANVKYEFAEQIKPAVQALQVGHGDCEELTSLVIALSRASKIPARAVWVPGHCYPEFYLEDAHGRGHWYPCQAAGDERQFGSMREERPILQKGDNFKVPEERGPQRYVKQFLSAKDAAAPPVVKWVLEKAE
jgi:transglutaminase-like putative cysteine protease